MGEKVDGIFEELVVEKTKKKIENIIKNIYLNFVTGSLTKRKWFPAKNTLYDLFVWEWNHL